MRKGIRMSNIKVVLSSLLFFLLSSQSQAEPSKLLAQTMTTQTSTFDFFLFKLEEQSKCYRGWFGNSKNKNSEKPCLSTLNYNFDDNLIKMVFYVDETNEKMIHFKASTEKKKETILRGVLSDIATFVGVEERNGMKIGMIQMTTIRNGWSKEGFDEPKIKEEIANRTVISVTANIKDGFIYKAIRNHHGKVFFEKNKSKY